MSRILVVGASGHAKVVLDIFEKQGLHQVVGLLDDFKPVGAQVFGYEVIGSVAEVSQLATQARKAVSIDSRLLVLAAVPPVLRQNFEDESDPRRTGV